eukprot:scaffold3842_cov191-Ochromonas_danica.AAC.1
MHNEQHEEYDFTSNINYHYEISNEEARSLLEQIQEEHPEYFYDYAMWLKLTTVMKSIDKFDIWDEFNKQYSGMLKLPNFRFYKKRDDDEINNLVKKENIKPISMKYISLRYQDFHDADTLILESGTGT